MCISDSLSTNAGGTGVVHYGTMRELTLGLEVALPNGKVWDGLRGLRKDNTGYDLSQLFIGAEGTLGVITAAVLKLFPRPAAHHTAFVAFNDLDSTIELLPLARAASADTLTAFEIMSRRAFTFATTHAEGASNPFERLHEW